MFSPWVSEMLPIYILSCALLWLVGRAATRQHHAGVKFSIGARAYASRAPGRLPTKSGGRSRVPAYQILQAYHVAKIRYGALGPGSGFSALM